MSLSYDSEVFERGQYRLVLSQRFKHMCSSFYGTLRVAIQNSLSNILLRVFPSPLAFDLFLWYLLFTIFLCILLASRINDKRNRRHEDPDLFDAIKSSQKVTDSIGLVGLLSIMLLVSIIGTLALMWREQYSFRIGILFAMVSFLLLSIRFLAASFFCAASKKKDDDWM